MNQTPLHLLIVEDSDDDLFLIEEALRQLGNDATHDVVRDGNEAIAYLKQQGRYGQAPRPSVVLLDLNLPGKSGFDVLREIRRDWSCHRVPVVVLTSSDSESDVVEAYASGANSFMTKPSDFPSLREALRHVLLYWTVAAPASQGMEREAVE